ncbi:hypothetical protein, conserved [Eimeria tenella]|uniref:Uncharacterized protein n=1 Tax=Eimeria tenella TaxID=5802 RepID=U6LBV3_EIMTE|nr:hypothetical protein, conserved [Eimeria tenella]CDJ45240.1 hypothetical protein, conserved [Eimeria tenella]|eukprot:XP_013235987.1 hypothetical protein, conserved [Eimeria tenella]
MRQQQQQQQQQLQQQQQQPQQHSTGPDELLEELWGGAGGLQGYLPLTKPLKQQQQQQQQEQRQQQPEQHDETASAAAAEDLQQQSDYYSLAFLFFQERDAQQQEHLHKPLKELESVLDPLCCSLRFLRGLALQQQQLQQSRDKLLLSCAGIKSALKYLLQRQTQAEVNPKP